jgi:hypothetical protein
LGLYILVVTRHLEDLFVTGDWLVRIEDERQVLAEYRAQLEDRIRTIHYSVRRHFAAG